MGHDKNDRSERVSRVFDRLAADKKKTAFAIALVAVMAFMWFKVLSGKKPGSVAAATGTTQEQQEPQKPPRDIRYLTLPNIPGRNDYINRDFFAARDWECFRENSGVPSGVVPETLAASSSRAQEVAARVAQKLKLEAVFQGENPQAFINERLLRVGERLAVRDGQDTCEFEVLQIREDSVLVGCNGTQLTLKLMQHLEVSN